MDHLTCFLPGTLALGHANGLPDWHLTLAEELLHTCYLTYAAHPTFLAPEITHFNLVSIEGQRSFKFSSKQLVIPTEINDICPLILMR